jgi:hypothetical protein
MLRKLILLSVFFLSTLVGITQNISSKLLDNETKEPIPFATIQFGENMGVMSNEEGNFVFERPKNVVLNDSIEISSLGFKTKRILLSEPIPEKIYLDAEIFEIAPVVLSNTKLTVDDIIENVKSNLSKNYHIGYTKGKVFLRETYKQRFKYFNFDVKKSTFENINQKVFDTILNNFPKRFTALVESYGDIKLDDGNKGKLQLQKMMMIQSKHEKSSIEGMQKDFLEALEKNTRSDSYLVIKSGIIRLDKTESIDSITKSMKPKTKEEGEKRRIGSQNYRNNTLNNLLKNLYINEDAEVDILNKSNKYEFVKTGYVELEDAIAFVLEFKPKGKAKYKGKLYINTEDFAIVRSEIFGARKIFDKKMNMLGINANELTYKSTVIFTKEIDKKYHVKYIKREATQEVGIDRPIKIIEKNKNVSGRKTQNKLSFQMTISIHNYDKKEVVFNHIESDSKSSFESFEPKANFTTGRFNSYNKKFWQGYNIITPEKAIQELKIED